LASEGTKSIEQHNQTVDAVKEERKMAIRRSQTLVSELSGEFG
jgi:hypothetical protein